MMRAKNIPNYDLMGPPDLCYIVKERKGGFMSSAPVKYGYYHHVIGVDTSSTATPSAYI